MKNIFWSSCSTEQGSQSCAHEGQVLYHGAKFSACFPKLSVFTHTHTYEGQRIISMVIPYVLPTSFQTLSLSTILECIKYARLASQGALGICLSLPLELWDYGHMSPCLAFGWCVIFQCRFRKLNSAPQGKLFINETSFLFHFLDFYTQPVDCEKH